MDDCIESLDNSTVYSAPYWNWGYWQMPITEEGLDQTTFVTQLYAFSWIGMPLELRNAPSNFLISLDRILPGVQLSKYLVYVDSVLIASRNLEDHIKHVYKVLRLLEKASVSLNIRKCQFFRTSLEYRGHNFLPWRTDITKNSASSIFQATLPHYMPQIRSFLGSCNVYSRLIISFNQIIEPLNVYCGRMWNQICNILQTNKNRDYRHLCKASWNSHPGSPRGK